MTDLGLIQVQIGPKNMAPRAYIQYTSKDNSNEPKNKFHVNQEDAFCKVK